MDCSFPRACEACGQEDGNGFNDGQWLCDACLKKINVSMGPEKPSHPRRIFTMQTTPLVAQTLIESANRSPPLGERAAQAVMEDRRHNGMGSPAKKSSSGSSVQMKVKKRKKKESRSQRFANRRGS